MKSTKQRIKAGITIYFYWLKDDQEFNGIDLVKHCLNFAGCPEKYPSTVLRYLREMRENKELYFTCISHVKSRYKKLGNVNVNALGQSSFNF